MFEKGEDIFLSFGPKKSAAALALESKAKDKFKIEVKEEKHENKNDTNENDIDAEEKEAEADVEAETESEKEPEPEPKEELFRISGSWTRAKELNLPKKISVRIAGIDVTARDTRVDGGKRGYMSLMKGHAEKIRSGTRPNCGVFLNKAEADEFDKKLNTSLKRLFALQPEQFKAEMTKTYGLDVHFLPIPEPVVESPPRGRGKRKKAVEVESETETEEEEEEDDFVQQGKRKRGGKGGEGRGGKGGEGRGGKGRGGRSVSNSKSTSGSGRGRKGSMDSEQEQPALKSPKGKSRERSRTKAANNISMLLTGGIPPSQSTHAALVAAGPYLSQEELRDELEDNTLTQAAFNVVSGNKNGFARLLKQSNVSAAGGASNLSLGDWAVFDKSELHVLERRMLEVLNAIEVYEVPDVVTDLSQGSSNGIAAATPATPVGKKAKEAKEAKSHEKGKRGRGRGKKSNSADSETDSNTRYLIDDYQEVPISSIIPDYNDYVRRRICFQDIQKKVQNHMYRSMSELSRDYYDLLNNARNVTNQGSQTWPDTAELARIFEEYKLRSLHTTPSSSSQIHCKGFSIANKAGAKGLALEERVCDICSDSRYVGGWPSHSDCDVSKGGSWVCGDCIQECGATLMGNEVAIWWDDDSKFYHGVVKAFDEQSGTHKVLYEDDEWEFVHLGQEVCDFKKLKGIKGKAKKAKK